MAEIDDYIRRVPDEALRRQLTAAASRLRDNKTFGLVFDHHAPEAVSLYAMQIRAGLTVQVRTEPGDHTRYDVIELTAEGDKARIKSVVDGSERTVAVKDLLVVESFGDPMYPTLTSMGRVQCGAADRPHHVVIESENYHALQLLMNDSTSPNRSRTLPVATDRVHTPQASQKDSR